MVAVGIRPALVHERATGLHEDTTCECVEKGETDIVPLLLDLTSASPCI